MSLYDNTRTYKNIILNVRKNPLMMCCNYPTTTIIIDDDINFLNIINRHFKIEDCMTYSSPKKAIEYLQTKIDFNRIQSRILKTHLTSEDVISTPENFALLVNVHNLHEEIYCAQRFSDVSVIIVDYHMEEMNGIDVCEALSNHPAKKILLTGAIDKEKNVIEAFNKGIIDCFINKSDKNFSDKLNHTITSLKEAYFKDLSSTILAYMPTTSTLLQNPYYINLIQSIKNQFNAIEYYLLDSSGSHLFLDKQGNPTWLFIKHESEINNYQTIAIDQEAPEDIINALANRDKFPYFFSTEDYQHSVSEWNEFLYQAHPLPVASGYYYAIANNDIKEKLIREKIFSYEMNNQK